jgi:hypothetical protein
MVAGYQRFLACKVVKERKTTVEVISGADVTCKD